MNGYVRLMSLLLLSEDINIMNHYTSWRVFVTMVLESLLTLDG
jgi:hypothetical protein